jgi:hypothetical protein
MMLRRAVWVPLLLLFLAAGHAARAHDALPISYPPRTLLVATSIAFPDTMEPWLNLTGFGITATAIDLGSVSPSVQYSAAWAGSAGGDSDTVAGLVGQSPGIAGGVVSISRDVFFDTAVNDAQDSITVSDIADYSTLTAGNESLFRDPISCGMGATMNYGANGQRNKYTGVCPNCPHILTTGADVRVAIKEKGTVDLSAGPAPFRVALSDIRDFGRPATTVESATHFARLVHWVSDENDSPTLDAGQHPLPSLTAGAGGVSATIAVSALLAALNWGDSDRGEGYCVYPGIVVVGTSTDAQSLFQYSLDGQTFTDLNAVYSDSNAFSLSASHILRLRNGAIGATTNVLRFSAWDGTSTAGRAGWKVLDFHDISGKRGSGGSTSVNTASLVVEVVGAGTTTGVPTTTGVASTTGQVSGALSTTGAATSQVAASSTASGGSTGGDTVLIIIIVVVAVVVVLLCVVVAVVVVKKRGSSARLGDREDKRDAGAAPNKSSESDERGDQDGVEVYGDLGDVLDGSKSESTDSGSDSSNIEYADVNQVLDGERTSSSYI